MRAKDVLLDQAQDNAKLLLDQKRGIRSVIKEVTSIFEAKKWQEIQPQSITTFELVEDMMVYCLIPCHQARQPCIINFKYITGGDLTVFSSLTQTCPDQYDHGKCKSGRPSIMKVIDKNFSKYNQPKQNVFTTNFIYMSMESAVGVRVEVLVEFPANKLTQEAA